MPVSGVNRPGVPLATAPSTTAPDVANAPPAAPTEAAPAAGWAARTGGTKPPSRTEAAVAKVKGKAVEVVLDNASKEHGFDKAVSLGSFAGNVRVSEQIALKGTDVYQNMVAVDGRRADFAEKNPGAVWVGTKAIAGLSAGFPAGAGVSLGFSGGVEVSSIMAHDVNGASDVPSAIANQGKSMALPLNADGLTSLSPAPGSEWMFRGNVGSSASAGLGSSATVGTGVVSASASVGVNVSASANETFTKNVKVLGDDKVYVQIARVTSEGTGASIGVTAGLNINAQAAVPGLAGKELDRAANKVEDLTRVNASVSANAGATQKLIGTAVLDLSTQAGRDAYDYLMKAGPGAAADFIANQHLGVKYDEAGKTASSGASLVFGKANLISTSTVRGTTKGTVEDPGSTTQLAEATYDRNVSGFLPRLALGEERSVSVRSGSVTTNGDRQDAVALSLSVKDTKLTPEELAQLDRFSKSMGAPMEGLAQAKTGGKADYAVSVSLTDAQVEKLATWGEEDVRLALAAAENAIDGKPGLPPYFADPASFKAFKDDYTDPFPNSDGPDKKQEASREYKAKYGRDLGRDVEASEAVDRIVGQMMEKKGKAAGEWGSVLEAVGKSSSTDVRAAALALRRLAGAEVVGLSVNVGGQSFAATSEARAPKTLNDLVGPMLAPPA